MGNPSENELAQITEVQPLEYEDRIADKEEKVIEQRSAKIPLPDGDIDQAAPPKKDGKSKKESKKDASSDKKDNGCVLF